MTDYISIPKSKTKSIQRASILDDFFSRYDNISPQDIYAWLWEGEFGLTEEARRTTTLVQLSKETQKAYAAEEKLLKAAQKNPSTNQSNNIYEYLGIAEKFIKINLALYSTHNCPLKRLIELQNLCRYHQANRFRFKQDWKFIKKISIEKKGISASIFDSFERNTGLYLSPKIKYTAAFLKKANPYYYIVPQKSFFRFFPEYRPLKS